MRDWDVRLGHTQMARCKYQRNALHVRKEGAAVKGVGKGWIKPDLVMGYYPKSMLLQLLKSLAWCPRWQGVLEYRESWYW